MKMQFLVRKRYLRFVLPVLAALLVIAFLLLLISGFGFRYLFKKPLPLKELTLGNTVEGTYVDAPVDELNDTFAYYGYEDDYGEAVVSERYALYMIDGKYLIVRVTHEYVPLLEKLDSADELVTSGQIGSILELNLGSFTGTLNPVNEEAQATLRNWITSHQIDAASLTDRYTGADISGYAGAADGNYSAYLENVILPVQLESGYLGSHTAGAVKALTVIAVIFLLLAILLIVSIFIGLWEKPFRAALRQHGKKHLTADFDRAAIFGSGLRIGEHFIWVSGSLFTRILAVKDVIWAYPRHRRLEGGKLRWSLVLKTVTGEEASVKLDSEASVNQAISYIVGMGWPLAIGYDKEKEKLYKKDLAAFQGRARNGKF